MLKPFRARLRDGKYGRRVKKEMRAWIGEIITDYFDSNTHLTPYIPG
jgi:hypothetical protein